MLHHVDTHGSASSSVGFVQLPFDTPRSEFGQTASNRIAEGAIEQVIGARMTVAVRYNGRIEGVIPLNHNVRRTNAFDTMPYSKCPICGANSHLNVAAPATWYRERYPDLPFGSLVPGVCFYCFGDISIGSRVIVRSHFTEHPDWAKIGAVATVVNIISSSDGSLFQLQFDDEHDDYFVRGELRKPHDDE